MGQKRCFICCQQCFPTRNGVKQKQSNASGDVSGSADKSFVENQVQVIFLLRKLLEIPEDTCCKLLNHFGNPNLWIECCDSCSVLVEKCHSIFQEIASLEKQYDDLRLNIKNTILKSEKAFDNECKCETIIRSQMISKDIDYFIETTTEKDEEASPFANTANVVDVAGASVYFQNYTDEVTLSNGDDQYHLLNNVTLDPLTNDAEEINSVIETKGNTMGNNFAAWGFDKNEELQDYEGMIPAENNYQNQDIDDGEINIKPPIFLEEEVSIKKMSLPKSHFEKHSIADIQKRQLKRYKKVQCSVCGRKIAAHILQIHMRTHTEMRPFKCDICGLRFMQKQHLRIHSIRHSDVKPHKCDLCGQRYKRRDVLTRHKKKVHTAKRSPSVENSSLHNDT